MKKNEFEFWPMVWRSIALMAEGCFWLFVAIVIIAAVFLAIIASFHGCGV